MIEAISAIIALMSFFIAFFLYRIQKRQPWAQALFNIIERMETEEMREIRYKIIYKLRDIHELTDEDKKAINRWGVEMDLFALLFFSHQLDSVKFFQIYGDVVIRSAYQLSPYANEQRKNRGEQFWLPFQELILEVLKMWSRLAKKNLYPEIIGFPDSDIRLTPSKLKNDHDVRMFLQANKLKIKI